MHGGDRGADGGRSSSARRDQRGVDLEAGKQLGHQRAAVAETRLADVLRRPERQHRARTGRQRAQRERLGGELAPCLVVVRDADGELPAVGERGDCGVEPSVAVRRQRACARDLGSGQCGRHRRG